MAVDERNFRSAYYEKVGFKSVEEKRSLEILLKDDNLDLNKLRQFCLRFGVPASYKNLVWKILLGVLPTYVKQHDFVMLQRREEYEELVHAINIMKINTNLQKHQFFVALWLLQNGHLKYNTTFDDEKSFILIVKTFLFLFDNVIDIFWLTKMFYDNICKFHMEIPKLIEIFHSLLEKEDQVLYKHLNETKILESLPLNQWFQCCFAGYLHNAALAKIWDKICGGSYKILIYVAIVILTCLKHRLMSCKNDKSAKKFINFISEETADLIAHKSIELWQKQGSPLTIYDKPKPTN